MEFLGGETLGLCFRLGLVFEALAPQVLDVSASGGVAVYGGFGARHGGMFEGRRCGWAGKRCCFIKDTERLVFEAGGMEDGMQQDMVARGNVMGM